MYLTGLLLALAAASFTHAAKLKIDTLTSVCSRSDPNLDECVLKSAQSMLPAMVKGIPQYGFPAIDPLRVPFLELSQNSGPVGLKLNISDTEHEGMRLMDFTKTKVDIQKNKWEVTAHFPRYSITGICDLGGRILLLPISGHGPCNLTVFDMEVMLNLETKMQTKKEKQYLHLEKLAAHVKFVRGSFVLSGLFGGNKELGTTMNRFLNENALEVLNEMKSTLESVWSELFQSISGRIFDNVPLEDMFKP